MRVQVSAARVLRSWTSSVNDGEAIAERWSAVVFAGDSVDDVNEVFSAARA